MEKCEPSYWIVEMPDFPVADNPVSQDLFHAQPVYNCAQTFASSSTLHPRYNFAELRKIAESHSSLQPSFLLNADELLFAETNRPGAARDGE